MTAFASRGGAAGAVLLVLTVLLAACTSEPRARRPAAASPTTPPLFAETATPAAVTARPVPSTTTTAPAPELRLLGHTDLGGRGFNANVRALKGYAYVGSWGTSTACPALGVRVVDLSDPAAPRIVATTARYPGTTAEDVVPVHLETAAFSGDVLAVGIQRCAATGNEPAGLALVDITDPRNPTPLSFVGTGARGVHELDVAVRPDRALALLAVPYGERGGPGDFRIVDITDPRRPVQLAAWGAGARLGITDGTGCNRAVYDHSVRASPDGRLAYLSYWDAGLIVLDITEPTAPRFVGRAVAPGREGAVHSADETPDGLLLVTEEDDVFRTPRGLTLRAEGSGNTVIAHGCEGDGEQGLDDTGVIEGVLVYSGNGCGVPARGGDVALVEEGGCGLAAKAQRARDAGFRALIVLQNQDTVAPRGSDGRPSLPVVAVGGEDGQRLRALAQGGQARVTLPVARPWGGVQVWDVRDPARPSLLTVFHTENSERFPPPGPGYYTVHNPLSSGRYALFSWYADGVRLVDFADPANPREVAAFVPPAAPDPFGVFPTAANVWGIAREGDLVLASDINSGLWVLRVTGLTAPR